LFGWTVNDMPAPAGLSVWVAKLGKEGQLDQLRRHIPLPTVVTDGQEIEFRAMRVVVRSLDVSLVYHPGWEIEHPWELENRALRLWPCQPDAHADFASLRATDPKDFAWLQGPRLRFFPGAFERGGLPALSVKTDPLDPAPGLIQLFSWP
jgi:hypothetical protein